MGMKLWLMTGGSLLFLVTMGKATAECPVSIDELTVNFGQVMPAPLDPVGTVLAEQTVTSNANAGDCEGGLNMQLSGEEAGQMVYSTGLAGIGYKIKYNGMPLTVSLPGTVQIENTPQFVVQLVKTQNNMGTGHVPSISVSMNAPYFDNRTVISLNIQAAISITTCALMTPDVVVPLPTLTTSAFAGRETTAGMTDFSIELYCYDGTSIDITFEPADSANSLPALGVLAAGATGVGVQLLHQGAPVTLQESLRLSQQAGALTLPFQARYYQMADEISAGSVQAMAKFSLIYQ